jgi:hypothetical protein
MQGVAGCSKRRQPTDQRELGFVGAGWRVTDDFSERLTVGNCGELSILAYESCWRSTAGYRRRSGATPQEVVGKGRPCKRTNE